MNALTQHNLEQVANATVMSNDKIDAYFVKHVDMEICVKIVDKETGLTSCLSSVYEDGVPEYDAYFPVSLHKNNGVFEVWSTLLGEEIYNSMSDEGFLSYTERWGAANTERVALRIAKDWVASGKHTKETLCNDELSAATFKVIMNELRFSDKARALIKG